VISRVRAQLRRVPSAAYWCALVAFLTAAAWSVVTPPFQVPDETAHVAYVQDLAENGMVPNDPAGAAFSDEQSRLIDALQFGFVIGRPSNGAIWYQLQDDAVDAVESQPLARHNGGGIQSNSNQPPLYYALTVPAYVASPGGGLLERMALMRLVSALLSAVTTLFVFLFLRELFVERWTWTAGSLAVAFQPVFGFISGGVTPDTLLTTASAALFLGFAQAFRRGLTVRRGAWIGAALAVGALAKLNFLALIPGAVLGLALLVWSSRERIRALQAAGVATGVLGAAAVAYVLLNVLVWDRSAWGGGETTVSTTVGAGGGVAPDLGLSSRLGYTWQLYLPRLPFMSDQFSYFPPYSTWFKGAVGLFGWLDTPFPDGVYPVALAIALPIAALAVIAVVQRRAAVLARWPEVLTYAVMALGLLVAIGFSGLRYRHDTGHAFEQARYLLPLLPLYGAAIALAALGAGRRFARPTAVALVFIALGHAAFAQLLVISRFYA
jgi:4-amino-4-deoxy-L-arabinose transferase-like glycosyltransferase